MEAAFPVASVIIEFIISDQSWPFLLNFPHPLKPRYLKVCVVSMGVPSIFGRGICSGHVDVGSVLELGVGGEIVKATDLDIFMSQESARVKSAESWTNEVTECAIPVNAAMSSANFSSVILCFRFRRRLGGRSTSIPWPRFSIKSE